MTLIARWIWAILRKSKAFHIAIIAWNIVTLEVSLKIITRSSNRTNPNDIHHVTIVFVSVCNLSGFKRPIKMRNARNRYVVYNVYRLILDNRIYTIWYNRYWRKCFHFSWLINLPVIGSDIVVVPNTTPKRKCNKKWY